MWTVCLLKSEENWIYSVSSPVVSDFPQSPCVQAEGSLILHISILPPLGVHTGSSTSTLDMFTNVGVSHQSFKLSKMWAEHISNYWGVWPTFSSLVTCARRDRGSETSVWQRPDQSNIHSHTCKFSVRKTRILLQNKCKNIRVERFGVFFRFMNVSAFPPRFSHPLGGTVGSLLLWKKRLQLCIGRRDGAATEEPGSVGVWGKKCWEE